MCAIDALLDSVEPDLVLVQGDTTSALAGALAAFYRKIPTGHIEAGLRTADPANPFPEEMNRRLITRLASLHFAATAGNRETLLSEGVDPGQIAVTGNPVVDSLHWVRDRIPPGNILREILAERRAENLVLLTAHRRERFGRVLEQQLSDIRRFVDQHRDLELVFPVHPNPNVRNAAERAFSHHPRIRLVPPLGYADFIQLLSESWLALSDSGGIQEEAPSLGVPLLVLRDSTERPEVVESGHAQLLGPDSGKLPDLLESKYQALHAGADGAQSAMPNPFGDGRAAARITAAVVDFLSSR
jgi:UDP-N-acetylglucosamine 2-epimerase (non-hydrolysing)